MKPPLAKQWFRPFVLKFNASNKGYQKIRLERSVKEKLAYKYASYKSRRPCLYCKYRYRRRKMEKQRTKLNKIAAKKFLCRYELKFGAKVVGILMCLVMAACIIATVIQALGLQECKSCSYNSWKHAYSFSISAAVYCCIMLGVNLWFLWGVKKEKASVVLSWVVITAVWLAQTICLLVVLIIQYSSEAALVAWVISLCCAILCVGILLYCLLVGYGYWLELKSKGNQEE